MTDTKKTIYLAKKTIYKSIYEEMKSLERLSFNEQIIILNVVIDFHTKDNDCYSKEDNEYAVNYFKIKLEAMLH